MRTTLVAAAVTLSCLSLPALAAETNPFAGQKIGDVLAKLETEHLKEFTKITGVKTDTPGAAPPEIPVNVLPAKYSTLSFGKFFTGGKKSKRAETNPFAGQKVEDVLNKLLDEHLHEFQKITGVKTTEAGAAPPEIPVSVLPAKYSTLSFGKLLGKRQAKNPLAGERIEDVLKALLEQQLSEFHKHTGLAAVDPFTADVPGIQTPNAPFKGKNKKRSLEEEEEVNPHAGKSYGDLLKELVAARMAEFRKNTGFTAEDRFASPPENPHEHAHARDHAHSELRMRRVRRDSEA